MNPSDPNLALRGHLGWSLVALASFHTAQILGLGWLLIPCGYALIELSRAATRRLVFYPMLALGFLFYAPQLGFFWGIFGAAAIALWLVLAFWVALFGLILRLVRLRFGIDGGQPMTLEDIGARFGITRERVRQIEQKAMRKLRHPSRRNQLQDYLES